MAGRNRTLKKGLKKLLDVLLTFPWMHMNRRHGCFTHVRRSLLLVSCLFPLIPAVHAGTGNEAGITHARQEQLIYLLRQDCGACHGMRLKGGLGPPLLPQNLAGKSAANLQAIILDGIPGTPMPPWRGELSEADAFWLAKQLLWGISNE